MSRWYPNGFADFAEFEAWVTKENGGSLPTQYPGTFDSAASYVYHTLRQDGQAMAAALKAMAASALLQGERAVANERTRRYQAARKAALEADNRLDTSLSPEVLKDVRDARATGLQSYLTWCSRFPVGSPESQVVSAYRELAEAQRDVTVRLASPHLEGAERAEQDDTLARKLREAKEAQAKLEREAWQAERDRKTREAFYSEEGQAEHLASLRRAFAPSLRGSK